MYSRLALSDKEKGDMAGLGPSLFGFGITLLGVLFVELGLSIVVDVAIARTGRRIDGALALLEPAGGNLGGVYNTRVYQRLFQVGSRELGGIRE